VCPVLKEKIRARAQCFVVDDEQATGGLTALRFDTRTLDAIYVLLSEP